MEIAYFRKRTAVIDLKVIVPYTADFKFTVEKDALKQEALYALFPWSSYSKL